MKFPIAAIFFLAFLTFNSFALTPANNNLLRTKLFSQAVRASDFYFDSLFRVVINARLEGKTSETEFEKAYNEIEKNYRHQNTVIAKIVQNFSDIRKEHCSKKIAASIDLLAQSNLKSAINLLEKQTNALNDSEKYFLADLYLLQGNQIKYFEQLPKKYADSIQDIYNNRFVQFEKGDTVAFVQRKILIAQKFDSENESASAIGTLLEAQKWNSYLNSSDTNNLIRDASIAYQLSAWQLEQADINNAYINGKKAYSIYQSLTTENSLSLFSKSAYHLAKVYQMAGASKEADTLYSQTIPLFQTLSEQFPEKYLPELATLYIDYSTLKRYFDQFSAHDSLLRLSISVGRLVSKQSSPFVSLEIARAINLLGGKYMNVDVKLNPAMEQWKRAKDVLDTLQKGLPTVTYGEEYADVLYRLGAGYFALKKYAAALPYFNQSLEICTHLKKLLPSHYNKNYIDLLVQNGTLNALLGKSNIATLQLDQAIKMAEDFGEKDRVAELRKFKKDVLTH